MTQENILEKIKKLREITGVGFKDCKLAIDETGGDIEKSIEVLRKKGISKASKRMQRVAAEGLVAISIEKNKSSIIEVNCETDFVAKNEEFINFVENISKVNFLNDGDLKKNIDSKLENGKKTKDYLVDLISKIGEKITIRRSSCLKEQNALFYSYIHGPVKKNLGKLGVIVSIGGAEKSDSIDDLGHKIAMHIAASNPMALDIKDFNLAILEKEKEIIKEELKNNGKDLKIVEKISEGKIKKYLEENTLMNQAWIMDPKKKTKDVIKELGFNSLKINSFVRFRVGEGI